MTCLIIEIIEITLLVPPIEAAIFTGRRTQAQHSLNARRLKITLLLRHTDTAQCPVVTDTHFRSHVRSYKHKFIHSSHSSSVSSIQLSTAFVYLEHLSENKTEHQIMSAHVVNGVSKLN